MKSGIQKYHYWENDWFFTVETPCGLITLLKPKTRQTRSSVWKNCCETSNDSQESRTQDINAEDSPATVHQG